MNESYLKKLPFAGKIVVATLLLSIGIGFTSAIVNLHFQSANAGQPLPGPEETVSEFHGSKKYSQIERLLIANETRSVAPFAMILLRKVVRLTLKEFPSAA